jgi:hypothetical protein
VTEEITLMRTKTIIAVAAIALFAVPVAAHHAFTAEFDANRPVKLTGAITKVEWTNPHAWMYIDVKDKSGKPTSWAIELAAPNAMLRRGWNKNSIPVGTIVMVEGWQAKNGSKTANGGYVTLPDGKRLFAASSGTGSPVDSK